MPDVDRDLIEDIDFYALSDDATVGNGHSVFQCNERAIVLAVPKGLFPDGKLPATVKNKVRDRLLDVVQRAMDGHVDAVVGRG